jgi:predicted aspartyl protease
MAPAPIASPTYRRTILRIVAQLTATVSLAACASACSLAASGAESVTVPIQQHGVHVYVDVSVDGKPATFVLDTGASANVITPQAIQRLHLTPGDQQTPLTGAAGGAGSVPRVKIDAIDVGAAHVTKQLAYVIALPEALPCDGLLGTQFLSAQVVTIDYERLRLTLTPREEFHPAAGATAIPLRFVGDTPFIEAVADGAKGWFRMDTGAGNGATLFAAFAERNHMVGKYSPSVRLITGRGVGGLTYGDLVRLPTLTIGPYRFTRPVVELSRQTEGTFGDRRNAGNLGGEIWQRFTLTLDYAGKVAYVTPNGHFDAPFITPRSGLAIDTEKGVDIVRDVTPGSPGAEVGIVPGDVVVAVGGVPIDQIKPWDLSAMLRREPGTRVRLRVRSTGGAERDVTLVLRDLL